ncbi:MAG: phosphatidylethanolamine N-methyltransferase family protein [Bacteroidetes bacterium]|nr:phosphatidylethanolamine N-methyltransferase family protein [Bacteroidota bacterium]
MTLLRLIIFTLLVPGTVAVFAPYWILQMFPGKFDIGDWRFGGMFLMIDGLVMYIFSALAFLREGGGTPAMWFTRVFSFFIGEEPAKLVRGKLYQFSRNPMYVSVLLFIIGEALWFGSGVLLIYAAIVLLFFHLTIVFIEEPHLRKKNGAAYEEYTRTVPRWFGFRKRQS